MQRVLKWSLCEFRGNFKNRFSVHRKPQNEVIKLHSCRIWRVNPLVKNSRLASVYVGWRGHWITGLLSPIHRSTRWSLLATFHVHLKTAKYVVRDVCVKAAAYYLFWLLSPSFLMQHPVWMRSHWSVLPVAIETHRNLNSINTSADTEWARFITERSLVFVWSLGGFIL